MQIRNIVVLAIMPLFAAGPLAAQEKTAKKSELKSLTDKASYGFGMRIGNGMKEQSVELNIDLLVQGIRDALAGKTLVTQEEADESLEAFNKQIIARMSEKNKKEGAKFLADNKKKEGVKTLPSGLQYKVVKAGAGPKPKADDVVKAHYEGTLVDGTVFDSSYARKAPNEFEVLGVIKGWTEALQLMTVGSKWQLVIPAELAYGEEGRPPVIAPNSTLIFTIELLEIVPKQEDLPRKKLPK